MADGNFEKVADLAQQHREAATEHDAAAHHHQQAAFLLSAGEKSLALKHAVAAVEHSASADAASQGQVDKWDDYDLDVRFDENVETLGSRPMVTSKFACTPGCAKTGSANSFCCSVFGVCP